MVLCLDEYMEGFTEEARMPHKYIYSVAGRYLIRETRELTYTKLVQSNSTDSQSKHFQRANGTKWVSVQRAPTEYTFGYRAQTQHGSSTNTSGVVYRFIIPRFQLQCNKCRGERGSTPRTGDSNELSMSS
jgi:hypothetical protein